MSIEDERSRIPNLMKIGAITTDMTMDYDTFILDPVVNGDTFSRFVFNTSMEIYRKQRFYAIECR